MGGKHVDGNFSVLRQLCLHLAHGQHHHHDLGVDHHVLRQQNAAPRKSCCRHAHLPVLFAEGLPEFIQDGRGKEGLRHEGVDAGFPGLIRHIVPVVGGQDDDGRFVADGLPDLPRGLDAVHAGHLPVHQDQVVGFSSCMLHPHHLHALLAGGCRFAVDAHLAQDNAGVLAGHRIIVNHQHLHLVGVKLSLPGQTVLFVLSSGDAQGDGDREGGSFALYALHVDVAVHQVHQAPGDGHAETCTSVLVRGRGILLAEGIENLRQILAAHADARIAYDKAQGGFLLKPGNLLHQEGDAAAGRGEFHRVAQNIQHHLAQLHVIADVVIIHLSDDAALVLQALFPALAADHGTDLLQGLREGEFLVVDGHSPRLDAGHIQDIVDNA